MDIAALSMTLSQVNVRQEANVSVMKKVMDQAETKAHGILKMLQESNAKAMELSVHPHIGSNLDNRG